MSFFGALIGEKAHELHDAAFQAVVSADPKGASEAQMQQYIHNVDTLASIAATAQLQADADAAKILSLKADYTRHLTAATLYSQKPESEQNQTTLNKLLDDAEKLKTDLETATASAQNSAAYAAKCKDNHAQAVTKLQSAREHLNQAMREQAQAQQDAKIADQRKHDQEIAAGLVAGGGDSLDAALNAMTAHTNALKQHIEAANLTSSALSGNGADDDVAAALAAVDAKPTLSAADRLAALKAASA
jgi:DNA repair exonuclease SbcCD ATPase subunit